MVDEKGLAALPMVEPVYPLTEGLYLNQVRKAMDAALRQNSGAAGMAGRGVAGAQSLFRHSRDALLTLHRPQEPTDIAPAGPGLDAARL